MKKRFNGFLLASASPRRRRILHFLSISFQVAKPHGIAEEMRTKEPPARLVRRLALEKASIVSKRYPRKTVLGADTVVVLGERMFGKPRNRAEAFAMLKDLQGREHFVWTGVALVKRAEREVETHSECAKVSFRKVGAAELRGYLNTQEPYDKAGGYDIQSSAEKWVRGWNGDYFTVMGLPVRWVLNRMGSIGP
jgi:septum formation protein